MKKIFVPLTKVDAEQRLVYGIAAIEQLDKANEIFDYASSKPLFENWSKEIHTLSAGKSHGNVREMHTKVAAGKLASPLAFDDANKTIEVVVKVVDNGSWEKVQEGVFTGFSIGGEYEKIWQDPDNKTAKRYTAIPSEISLVDNPCMPGAGFQFIKAGGATELRKFVSVEINAEVLPLEFGKAAALLATPGPAGHEAAARVMKRAAELKSDFSGFAKAYVEVHGTPGLAKKLSKSMYDIQTVACMLSELNWCRQSLEYEAESEGDGSKIPARMKEIIATLGELLVDLAAEETKELTEAMKAAADKINKETETMKKFFAVHGTAIEKAAASTDPELKKMATHLKEIGKHVDGIRKAHDAMGEHLDELDPEEEGKAETEEKKEEAEKLAKAALKKADEATGGLLSKQDARLSAMETLQKETSAQVKNIADSFATFLKMTPAPATVAINPQPVTKAADGSEKPVEKLDPKDPDAALKMMKGIHAAGPVSLQK